MTLGVIGVAGGSLGLLAVGLVVGWLVGKRERDSLKESLRAAEESLARFRSDVGEHFDRAEELFGDLTRRYEAYSRHLAAGAATLASGKNRSFPAVTVAEAAQPSSGVKCAAGATPNGASALRSADHSTPRPTV